MSEKLVRDNMPDICDKTPDMTPMNYRVAGEDEMQNLLINKLHEEVSELTELMNERGKGIKTLKDLGLELADIKEVIEALAAHFGLFETDIEIIQKEKKSIKGGFKKRIVWDGNK